ncbi:hypothetical protein BGZ70_007386 [Mortierella alpina]|uniref:HIT-type domain-containing protein n=1 Tax=Mortierella alpina TaxID=64518 RepID=A0A9P6J998_MORAP|nr:hypothetical protein BGZ70_007386 [Mortierella alpina]
MSSRKPERTKTAPRVLDREARSRQLRNHLESLERDNFVVLNEYEAIIATAAAAASAPGPATLNAKPIDTFQDPSSVGVIVGNFVGTGGSSSSAVPTGRWKGKKPPKAGTSGDDLVGGSTAVHTRRPVLSRKPLHMLLEESGIADYGPSVPSYLTVNMGPSRYPDRQFCSVCGWKGKYRCSKCGMRYCDLRCLKTHEETR